ncbi:hypothetical protein ERHA55_10580 [Erwinia rhapontici]|nr:hypothetical protein ERHA55_10580 [Erwinia rhapontici]
MKRQIVASSAIHSVGYDADKRILEVELLGHGRRLIAMSL